MSSRWAGIRDVGKWANPNVTVKSLMVMDSSGVVRQFKPGDNLPQCIIDAIGNVGSGSGGGGGAPQQLRAVPGTFNTIYLSISEGNTVQIPSELQTTADSPAIISDGVVSTNIIGGDTATLGRPSGWVKIAGTSWLLPVYTGMTP